jgi:CheY-like chemotaxis protein
MTRVLVIDDDPNKIRQLTDCVKELFPCADVVECRSYQSGLKAGLQQRPDIIILDMTMPTFDVGGKETGGRERRYAGLQILRQLKRKSAEIYTVVVTQFEQFGEGDQCVTLVELEKDLAGEFNDYFLGAVYYQAADSRWRDELKKLLSRARQIT